MLPSVLESELKHFARVVSLRTSHILDACIHIQTSRLQRHVLEHRRRHRWRGFDDFRMNGQISHMNSVQSQCLRDMLDMATAPRQVAQGDRASEKLENITDDKKDC